MKTEQRSVEGVDGILSSLEEQAQPQGNRLKTITVFFRGIKYGTSETNNLQIRTNLVLPPKSTTTTR